jgi:hypothetical protein
MWRLFLDDLRTPLDSSWKVARSVSDAKALVSENGTPAHIAFDHDLGEGPSGYDFLKWLVEQEIKDFDYSIHTSNPPGRANLLGLARPWTEREPVNGPAWSVPEDA